MDPITEQFTYRGAPVSYKVTGRGKPLVILHGWGTNSRVMIPLAGSLANLRTCYIPDLPGFGDSPAPSEPWNIDRYADLVEEFIRSLDSPEVDLLAHSFGGRITLKLLSRPGISEKIGKVLITGGAGMKPKRSASFYFKKTLAKILKAPFYLLPAPLRAKPLEWLRATPLWKMLGSSDYRELSGVMRETFVLTVTEHLDSILDTIHHDILLLWGRDDASTPLYQAERMENGLTNGALVVIEKAGHYAFLDKPNRFTAIARAYFEN
ncbi:MAG: alpha/beta hydrolase [Balneolaceae bacterium]